MSTFTIKGTNIFASLVQLKDKLSGQYAYSVSILNPIISGATDEDEQVFKSKLKADKQTGEPIIRLKCRLNHLDVYTKEDNNKLEPEFLEGKQIKKGVPIAVLATVYDYDFQGQKGKNISYNAIKLLDKNAFEEYSVSDKFDF